MWTFRRTAPTIIDTTKEERVTIDISLLLPFENTLLVFKDTVSIFFEDYVYLPLVNILYWTLFFVPPSYYPKLPYTFEEEIISTTPRVIFIRSKHDKQKICLKLWQRYDEKVFKAGLVIRRADYLLEGFEFNRRFAPGVYLGITPVKLSKDPRKILRGKLIENPDQTKLRKGVEYALVMKRLPGVWRLDRQLCQNIGTAEGMKFLAKEVACMHKKLEKSLLGKGKPECIASKLALNRQLFEEALRSLPSDHFTDNYIENYRWIGNVMDRACNIYTPYFKQRYENGHIKRCHGDLKATNLWIRPKKRSGEELQELIALDCVDFNPDFCHIDTLSDVAMLAIDIETLLTDLSDKSPGMRFGQKLAEHFLYTYLEKAKERSEAAWSLLEYYMTEKSMVCAYVSILYDNLPEQGKRYLDVARNHAQKLENTLKQAEKRSKVTRPLAASHSR